MSDTSKIEWTDATWNPTTGCTKVSQGCKHCYAERLWPKVEGARVAREGGAPRPFEEVRIHRDRLAKPLHWREPRMVFVDSMSDLFHEDVPDEFIDKVFAVMGTCQWHTFQILTKRPQRMLEWFSERWQPSPEQTQRDLHTAVEALAKQCGVTKPMPLFHLDTAGEDRFDQVYGALDSIPRCVDTEDDRLWKEGRTNVMAYPWPFPNVWLGVSVEDQATADERIPLLLQTPAAVRWISAEPLLGPLNIETLIAGDDALRERGWIDMLSWVVAGGESGPHARPSHPDWFRSLRDQCAGADVPFFFKQWGEFSPTVDVVNETTHRTEKLDMNGMVKVGKRAAGRLLDGRLHDEYPA